MAKSSLPVSKLYSNMLAAQDRQWEPPSWSGTAEVEGRVERAKLDVLVPWVNDV